MNIDCKIIIKTPRSNFGRGEREAITVQKTSIKWLVFLYPF